MMIPVKEYHLSFLENDNICINKLIILQKIIEIIDEMQIWIVVDLYDHNLTK